MTAGLDPETLGLILDSISEFSKRELPRQLLLDLDARDAFPADLVRRMCGQELGIQLLFIDEEYGGMGGDTLDIYRVCERLASVDVGLATGVLATALGSDPITVGGTPEQAKRWMSRIADEGLLMAYGATEPEAGSDLAALKSVAVPIVEEGVITAYRISGRKQWISNGGVADLYSILARAPGGPSWFVVDRDTAGLTHGEPEDKHGIRLSNTAALYLDNVLVEADRLLGDEEGKGLAQAQQVFGYTRLMVAAFGLGAGWAALDIAIPYSTGRVQAGGPLSEKQGYTHKLVVPHAVRLEAARSFVEETAGHIDAGDSLCVTEGAIAKYLATEFANGAADAAIQALGGYGYTRDFLVEKIRRDVRITTIYEGTSEIMELTIGRERWQQHLKTSGRHYHDRAEALESLQRSDPSSGAGTAAIAHRALAEVLEACRLRRLTRHQHVLLRLGELEAWTECAAAMARRAARAAAGTLLPKADRRFDAEALAAMSRVFAREASLKVVLDGARWLCGASPDVEQSLTSRLGVAEVLSAQCGLLEDMDVVAAALYGGVQ